MDIDQLLEQLHQDFKFFLKCVFMYLHLPEPTPLQYEIANYLQDGPTNRIIQTYRGCGKSYITCCYVVWRLYNNPNEKFLIVSATHEMAKINAHFIKRIINEVPFCQHLKPRKENEERDSVIVFDVAGSTISRDPSVKCAGIRGQITGSRATEIVADDVEIPMNSDTQDARERLLTLVKEFAHIIVKGGRITFLGTPQTSESIYNTLRYKHNYARRIWPARYPRPDRLKAYGTDLAPSIAEALESDKTLAWKPTDPLHFDEQKLLENEGTVGRTSFMLQFMLDTSLSDAELYPLKISDLIVMPLDTDKGPRFLSYGGKDLDLDTTSIGQDGDRFRAPLSIDQYFMEWEGSIMAIDPSGCGKFVFASTTLI